MEISSVYVWASVVVLVVFFCCLYGVQFFLCFLHLFYNYHDSKKEFFMNLIPGYPIYKKIKELPDD